jgi:tetratricopeptide (TPR) repeat protein
VLCRHALRLLIVSMLLLPSVARAEDRERARQHFKEGAQHFDLGEYKEALSSFKEAYRDYEDPTFLFNIAQCFRQLGDKEQAIRSFRTYLAKVPDAPNSDDVKHTIATLQEAIDKERAARSGPPQGTLEPSRPEPTVAPTPSPAPSVVETKPVDRGTPVYKKWWLWTLVGVVVVGAAVGAGVGVATARPPHPTASTDFGTMSF